MAASSATGRLGTPEDLGSACAWLSIANASFVSGQNLPVEGGPTCACSERAAVARGWSRGHPLRMPSLRTPRELEALLALPPSETTPLLLALTRAQAARRRPSDLPQQMERDGFFRPAVLDQRMLHRLDGLALDAASEFEAIQLSPVAPLGACSALAPTSQDRTLTAMRATEVVSDPTNVLALECARRLAGAPAADLRLCTVHQVLRAQRLPGRPGPARRVTSGS